MLNWVRVRELSEEFTEGNLDRMVCLCDHMMCLYDHMMGLCGNSLVSRLHPHKEVSDSLVVLS